MSLDIDLYIDVDTGNEPHRCVLFDWNITHNLTVMAKEAGIYKELWRPEEIGIKCAEQLIEPLVNGLIRLTSAPRHYKEFNPSNKWGTYEGLVEFVREYLAACKKYPKAKVYASR